MFFLLRNQHPKKQGLRLIANDKSLNLSALRNQHPKKQGLRLVKPFNEYTTIKVSETNIQKNKD